MWRHVVGRGRDVVFLHGWTMDHRDEMQSYEPIFQGRANWRRHYVDLPGMGQSAQFANIANLDDMLLAVLNYIEQELPGNFVISGTSAGAYLARGVIARLRPRVDGALFRVPLVDPWDEDRDLDPITPVLRSRAWHERVSGIDKERLGDLLVETPAYAAAKLRKLRESVEPAVARANHDVLRPIRASRERYRLSVDPDATIGTFDKPSLIIAGRQDESVGYRDAWRLANIFTRSTFAVLDRAEHGLPIDQQGLFAALVNEWLDRLEERAKHL